MIMALAVVAALLPPADSEPVHPTLGATGAVDPVAALRAGALRQLTTHGATDLEPKWSPDGSTLSFASDRTGTWNVWTVPRDGGEQAPVTSDLELVHSTWWSPDGRRLALAPAVRTEDGFAGRIELLDLEKGGRTPLTSGPVDGAPCWSPDGRRIAFVSNRTGNFDLWVVNVASGEEVQLTFDEGFDHSPRWSPDGGRIAFHSGRSGNGDIWLLNLVDGALTRLTVSEGFDHFPTWSPDGRYLAFHSNRSGSFDLWVVPAGGGEAVQLTSGPAEDQRPAWSPDGTAIAFSSDRGGSMDIWTLSVPDPTGGPAAP